MYKRQLYHNTKDAVNEFSKKYNCDLALAEEYLKVVRGIRNQQPFYVTDEDLSLIHILRSLIRQRLRLLIILGTLHRLWSILL